MQTRITRRIAISLALLMLAVASPAFAEFELLRAERIGPLRHDMPGPAVLSALGKPASKTTETFEAATGDYIQTWQYPARGITAKLSGAKKGGAKKLSSVTIQAPCPFATSRGIRIGSPEAAVRKAYAREIDRSQAPPGQIVAGSIYGGVIFDLAGGRVKRIFLGAAAE